MVRRRRDRARGPRAAVRPGRGTHPTPRASADRLEARCGLRCEAHPRQGQRPEPAAEIEDVRGGPPVSPRWREERSRSGSRSSVDAWPRMTPGTPRGTPGRRSRRSTLRRTAASGSAAPAPRYAPTAWCSRRFTPLDGVIDVAGLRQLFRGQPIEERAVDVAVARERSTGRRSARSFARRRSTRSRRARCDIPRRSMSSDWTARARCTAREQQPASASASSLRRSGQTSLRRSGSWPPRGPPPRPRARRSDATACRAGSARAASSCSAPGRRAGRRASESASRAHRSGAEGLRSNSVAGSPARLLSSARRAAAVRGRKPTKRNGCGGSPDAASAVVTADAPGTLVTAMPASIAARTSR